MKITIREALHALLCLLAFALFAGAERHNIAVNPDGVIYSIGQRSSEIVVSHLSDGAWKRELSFPATTALGNPSIAWVGGGLLSAWQQESEGKSELAFAFSRKNGAPVSWKYALPSRPRSVALEDLGGSKAGLLAIGSESRWLEIDVRTAKVVRSVEIESKGSVRYPSILPGSVPLIAWEERNGDALNIAVARINADNVEMLRRFRVRGFGSVSMPVLLQAAGPAIVWQGTRDKRAALFTRSLSEKGFGSVKSLPVPEGLRSVIRPRRAVGSYSVLSASTWNNVRWSAARYDLSSELTKPQVALRTDDRHNMRRPVMVAGKEESWLWSDTDGVLEQSTSLSDRVFEKPLVSPAADGEKKYLAFGDSITEGKLWLPEIGEHADPETTNGYTLFLQEQINDTLGSAVVDQKGDSGEDTLEGLDRLQGLLETAGVYDRVLLLEGTNDWTLGDDSVEEVTIPNLTQMVAMIRAHGAVPIVGTMLPRDRHPQPGSDARAKMVTAAMIPVMQRLGVRIARFHELFPLDDEHLADQDGRRLHPTLKGYALMADIWMEALLTFEGDINRDGKVDYLDAQRLSAALGTRRGNFLFNPDGDVNTDGIINIFDLSFVFGRFGTDFTQSEEASLR